MKAKNIMVGGRYTTKTKNELKSSKHFYKEREDGKLIFSGGAFLSGSEVDLLAGQEVEIIHFHPRNIHKYEVKAKCGKHFLVSRHV